LTIPIIGAYAEIHYTLNGIKAKYYKSVPEIIFDLPVRCILSKSKTIPLALIVKDSHQFPCTIFDIKVSIKYQNCQNYLVKETLPLQYKQFINKPFYSHLFEIPVPDSYINQSIEISVHFKYSTSNTQIHKGINDNYKALPSHSFTCFISTDPLPFPAGYWKGEPHYHSDYTSDQVEFGAPLYITKRFAMAMGMDWLFVTDHSYDLDDYPDDYIKNDPDLTKWKQLENECNLLNQKDFRMIQGEEVSIGNHKNKNIHLLAVGCPFIHGKGDSAEEWFKNRPDYQLKDLPDLLRNNKNGLLIAAHPFEDVPLSQKITLNRGNWHLKDYIDNKIEFLQGINQNSLFEVLKSISKWKTLLLQGHYLYLLAGNDAHGNFQYMKQIKIPFIKLFLSKKQIFARFFTVFRYTENNPIEGIKSKHLLISNGPFIDFQLKGLKTYHIGDTVSEAFLTLIYHIDSMLEFGEISLVKLFIGDIDKKKEICYTNPENHNVLTLPKRGYIRMECLTQKLAIAITNPIWINQLETQK